jgi:acetyl-CoA carboxylase biotin carboxyl carrier protein
MKMETPIFVPCDGVVKEVRVKDGDEVTENDILAVIEKKHIEV